MSRPRLLASGKGRALLLGERAGGEVRVEPIELFFDLVYVFAITQLTLRLLANLSPRGAAETLLLLIAVWSAWSATAWMTSGFDTRTLPIRRLLIALMLGSLFLSTAIPDAFGAHGLAFAASYVAIQVGRGAVVLFAIGPGHPLSAYLARVLFWSSVQGIAWIAGGFADGDRRLLLWALAVAIDFVATWLGFPVPRLGRTRVPSQIAGAHLAERNELFIILALGESILETGVTFGELPRSPVTIAALIVAFAGSVAMWWIYFDRGAEAGREAISQSLEPGRLGLAAYSYSHLPMVAGIILAAGADALTIPHPLAPTTVQTALILGGPALYLVGNALFTGALSDRLPRSRIVAIAALAAMTPVADSSPALVSSAAAASVLIAVALWDMRSHRRSDADDWPSRSPRGASGSSAR